MGKVQGGMAPCIPHVEVPLAACAMHTCKDGLLNSGLFFSSLPIVPINRACGLVIESFQIQYLPVLASTYVGF